MLFPEDTKFKPGDPVAKISRRWLQFINNFFKSLEFDGGEITVDVNGNNAKLTLALTPVNVLTDIEITEGGVVNKKYTQILVPAQETQSDVQLGTMEELNFLKVTSLDGDGCPDATDWRKIGFIKISDVDIDDDDLSEP